MTIRQSYDPFSRYKNQYTWHVVPKVSVTDGPKGETKRNCLCCGKSFAARTKFLRRCDYCLTQEGWDVRELGKRETQKS